MATEATAIVSRYGNLAYTRRGLFALFAWLLWGDFCFTLMEAVVPSILPLKMQSLHSSNWLIALVMSTLPGIFNTTLCPWVSFKSDRHRGRWGRRIPFILATMPFLAVSLVLIGFSDELGRWVHGAFFAGSAVRQSSVIILLLAIFAGCFDLFNMFVNSVYWYLFNDVVPPEHLGQFIGRFKAVSMLTGALYNYLIFRYAQSHMREIYLGAAVLYVVGFGLMCLRIKEREYPPPADAGQKPSLLRDIRTFARECYTNRFYWDIFLGTASSSVGNTIVVFNVFFLLSLGLDLDVIGKLTGVTMLVIATTMIFAGGLVDRWHPVRVMAYFTAFGAFFAFTNWVWLFAEVPSSTFYFWLTLAVLPFAMLSHAISGAASLPREMMLFPRDRFGQFCGAQALIRSACTMLGGLLAGFFIDGAKLFFPDGNYAYRFNFLWSGCFTVLGFAFQYRAFRVWKRLGGEQGYRPPANNCRLEELPPRPDGHGTRRSLLAVNAFAACGTILAAVAYCTWYSRSGNTHLAWIFGIQIAVLLTILGSYLAFVRFMERP